jgi:hypothetical protein
MRITQVTFYQEDKLSIITGEDGLIIYRSDVQRLQNFKASELTTIYCCDENIEKIIPKNFIPL